MASGHAFSGFDKIEIPYSATSNSQVLAFMNQGTFFIEVLNRSCSSLIIYEKP